MEATIQLNKRTVTLHGGRTISVLTPCDSTTLITGVDNQRGYYLILSNGTGYDFLSKLMALAGVLEKDEIIHLPFGLEPNEELKSIFPNGFYKDMVLINYCAAQLKPKDIDTVLKAKRYREERVSRTCNVPEQWDETWCWKNRRKLTVKAHGKTLIMSTNKNMFVYMAMGCVGMAECGDDAVENLMPHEHYDWQENTAKSVGITLHYWHNGGI